MATQYYNLPTYDGEDKNKPISYQVGWTNAMRAIDTALHNNALAAEPVEGLEEDVTSIQQMVESVSNGLKTLNDFMNRWNGIITQLYDGNSYNILNIHAGVNTLRVSSNGVVAFIEFKVEATNNIESGDTCFILTPKDGVPSLENYVPFQTVFNYNLFTSTGGISTNVLSANPYINGIKFTFVSAVTGAAGKQGFVHLVLPANLVPIEAVG